MKVLWFLPWQDWKLFFKVWTKGQYAVEMVPDWRLRQLLFHYGNCHITFPQITGKPILWCAEKYFRNHQELGDLEKINAALRRASLGRTRLGSEVSELLSGKMPTILVQN